MDLLIVGLFGGYLLRRVWCKSEVAEAQKLRDEAARREKYAKIAAEWAEREMLKLTHMWN